MSNAAARCEGDATEGTPPPPRWEVAAPRELSMCDGASAITRKRALVVVVRYVREAP